MMGISQHSLFVGLFATLLLVNGAPASAGLMVTTVGTFLGIGFDGYQGDGFVPDPSSTQLDSDHWRITGLSQGAGSFGGSFATGDFARGSSTGGVTTGGIYGFNVDPDMGFDWALGFQPIGSDLTPGAATLMVTNATGTILDRLDLEFQVLVRNDGDRSSTFGFAYSSNDTDYQQLDELQVISDLLADPSPSWVAVARKTSLAGLNLLNGSSLFLQWRLDDLSGTGSRDEWALDNIDLVFATSASTVPEPSSWVLVGMLCPAVFWTRRRHALVSGRAPILNEHEKVIRRRCSASFEAIPVK